MTLVAGVDSSTQSCKVVVRDLETGRVVREGRAGHPVGTSVDPNLWWDALVAAIADAGGLDDIAAISIGGQQHGMVALDESGRVIRDALLWNDTRSAGAASDLIAEVGAAEFATRTGSVPVASFTITKLRWLADAEPENAARVAAVALPHDWLTWRLRGFGPGNPVLTELTTDRSDASGTLYFNPATNEYDRELVALALAVAGGGVGAGDAGGGGAAGGGAAAGGAAGGGAAAGAGAGAAVVAAAGGPDAVTAFGNSGNASRVILPKVLGPGDVAGHVDGSPELFTGGQAIDGVVVGVGAGDNAGAALGLGATSGDVVISIGTSGTVFAVTDTPSRDKTGTVAGFADAAGGYLPLVATLNAARVLDAIARLLGVDHDALGTLALAAEPGSGGAVLHPYFEGERTPNLPNATATLSGLTLASTSRENLARSAIEGMLCGLADGLDAVLAEGVTASRLLLVGGAAQNPAVSAIAAQVFEVPVVVPEPAEYVALGAAVQAAWALTGERPTWPVAFVAELAPDYRPVIRSQYAAS